MPIFFRKNRIPGPESEREKRSQEADQLMADWYEQSERDDLTRLEKKDGWRSVLIIFIVFMFVSALGLVIIYWIIQGKTLALPAGQEGTVDPLVLDLSSPAEVSSGDTITFVVTYSNESKARLVDINLDVFYPDNFIFLTSTPETPQNFDNSFWRLPSLEPHSSRKLEIEGQILGSSGEVKEVEAVLIYKPTNFHSTFKKKAKTQFSMNKSALAVTLEAPDNLLPQQEVKYKVLITNTSGNILDNVKVKLSYPPELSIKSSSAELTTDNFWLIKQVNPQEQLGLTIVGDLTSQVGELKEFKAEVGLEKEGRFVLQNRAVQIAAVIRPDLDLMVRLMPNTDSSGNNEQSGTNVLKFGGACQAQIVINNLSTLTLEDGVLELKINDRQNLLVWGSLQVLEDYRYEVISEGSGLKEGEQIIRFVGLGVVKPAEEIIINFSFDLIEVPYDISALEFIIKITPSFSAASPDLSVPVEVEGAVVQFEVSTGY